MATLDEITSGALRRWLDGPCGVEITTVTRFNVPGAEVALRNPKLDAGFRETLEMVTGDLTFQTEGEQRDADQRRLRIRMLGGGSEQKRCHVVSAGRVSAYSRDGRRFGRLRSSASPAETELAIRPLLDLDHGGPWSATPEGGRRAVLGHGDVAAVVDLERILGPRAQAAAGATVEVRCDEDHAELLLELVIAPSIEAITAAMEEIGETLEEASGAGVSSVTSTHARWSAREVEPIVLPELSLSIPEMGTLRQVFSLATANRAGGRRRQR
jgi:hypothetical protein